MFICLSLFILKLYEHELCHHLFLNSLFMAWKIGKFKCKLINLYNFWCQIKKNHKIKSHCGKFVENNNWKVGNLYMVLDVVGGHQSYFCMTNETRNGILTNVKGKMSLSLFQSTVENCNFRETQFVFMSTKHQIFVITFLFSSLQNDINE